MSKLKDVISSYRVENIEEPLLQQIRYLDKLVEGLVKSTPMENYFGNNWCKCL